LKFEIYGIVLSASKARAHHPQILVIGWDSNHPYGWMLALLSLFGNDATKKYNPN
jgi:hypothetical protein